MNRAPAPGPPALRLQRPGWRDPRLVVGVLLVAGSVALGSWSVRVARQTEPVLTAVVDLPAGHVLTTGDLRPVEVALGQATESYLAAGTEVEGTVLARSVSAGELVPARMLVEQPTTGLRTVAIPLSGPLPADVVVGGLVDVWMLPEADAADAAPRSVARGLDVTAVRTETGAFSSGLTAGTTVEVRVGDADLPTVLGGLADGVRLTLVAAPVATAATTEPSQAASPTPTAAGTPAASSAP